MVRLKTACMVDWVFPTASFEKEQLIQIQILEQTIWMVNQFGIKS